MDKQKKTKKTKAEKEKIFIRVMCIILSALMVYAGIVTIIQFILN